MDLPEPSAILESIGKAYASCKTYQDHGRVETQLHYGRPTAMKSTTWFTTYFKRPNLFRFAFVCRTMEAFGFPDLMHVVWSDGKRTHVKSPIWPLDRDISLEMAVAGATGISSGSAHTVPALLMPDQIHGNKLTALKKLEYVKAEDFQGESCDVLHHEKKTRSTDYWISQSRSVIRCIRETDTLGPNMGPMLKERGRVESFGQLLTWYAVKTADAVMARMDPVPMMSTTSYLSVVLDEDLPDSVFAEEPRR